MLPVFAEEEEEAPVSAAGNQVPHLRAAHVYALAEAHKAIQRAHKAIKLAEEAEAAVWAMENGRSWVPFEAIHQAHKATQRAQAEKAEEAEAAVSSRSRSPHAARRTTAA